MALNHYLKQNSIFLFGPRATGKSHLIKQQLKPDLLIDLLKLQDFNRYTLHPELLGEELRTLPKQSLVVIDEIQKIPALLDEVHSAIENLGLRFLLTGSSARKLKRSGANLLAGRAWRLDLFPLTFHEISNFDFLHYLNSGGLPRAYLHGNHQEELNTYVSTYLKEEVMQEALTRNLPGFSRFLEVMALQCGEELSYEGIANDTGLNSKTIKNFVEVLEDTLIGFSVPAFKNTKTRKAITRSKFYLFDVGVANHLAEREVKSFKNEGFGKSFEHFIAMELRAYLSYSRSRKQLQYWRSTSKFEVDFIIGKELAIEVKGSHQVNPNHLKGLRALKEEKIIKNFCVVSLDEKMRQTEDGITIYPWEKFLTLLWDGKLLEE